MLSALSTLAAALGMLLLVLSACGGAPAAIFEEALRLAALDDPRAWEVCGRLRMDQGRGGCRVVAARALQEAQRTAACAEIVQAPWRSECWFELAEEHAQEQHWRRAIDACGHAELYRVDCARHVYQQGVIRGAPAENRARILAGVPEAASTLDMGLADVAFTTSELDASGTAGSNVFAPAVLTPVGTVACAGDQVCEREAVRNFVGRWRRSSLRDPAVRAALCDPEAEAPPGLEWVKEPAMVVAMDELRVELCP